jgi:hypothetical protein
LVGWRFTADGELVRMPAEERVAVLNAPREGDDAWVRLARWVVTPSARRTIHPDSPRTLHEIAERERDFGTQESLESSLRYDATMPLARLMLAGVLEREDAERKPQEGDPTVPARASFLRDYDLKNLPRDAEIWARAVKILHSQKAAEPTQRALEKLEKLDPAKAKAVREEISRDTDIGLDLTRGTDG